MKISTEQVKQLRDQTGAGMMDCKKALLETGGDLEAAVDWLRKKGFAAASKKGGRTAAEGLVGAVTCGKVGALLEVNSETDFVARNDVFQKFVKIGADLALQSQGDIELLKQMAFPGKERSVQEESVDLIATIGENIHLRRVAVLQVSEGVVACYVHNAVAEGLGRLGVLVALRSSGMSDRLKELGRRLAMHVAAACPQGRTREDIDPQLVARERAIATEQAQNTGKPVEVIEKMVEGRLRKFFEESALMEQVFLVDDTKRKVSQVVEDASKEMGSPIELVDFASFKLGEGIEKQEKDFASEVAEQLKK